MHSSKSNNTEPDVYDLEEKAETVEETDSSPETPADASSLPEDELKAVKAEALEWQDRFLRKAAEFENFRKRTDKERADAAMLARSNVLMEFLPVADACERALQSMEKGTETAASLEQYREGVELLYKQLLDTFGRAGVVPIETEGMPFDPHLHEALSRKEDTECETDTIVQEVRRGYLYKDRLLRPAQVIVAVPSEANDKES